MNFCACDRWMEKAKAEGVAVTFTCLWHGTVTLDARPAPEKPEPPAKHPNPPDVVWWAQLPDSTLSRRTGMGWWPDIMRAVRAKYAIPEGGGCHFDGTHYHFPSSGSTTIHLTQSEVEQAVKEYPSA